LNWLSKRAQEGGPYLDSQRYPYEELRENTYKTPYTDLTPGVVPFRGVEPGGDCPTCGMKGKAQGDRFYCVECQDWIKTQPRIIGPSQLSEMPSREDTGFPADKTFLPTAEPEGVEDGSYYRYVYDY
jgi:hypothetical protein